MITVYITLVLSGNTTWMQPEPAFTAMVITGAIMFTAVKIFPPTFYTFFAEVKNLETGEVAPERLHELTIPKGQEYPICLPIVNTGTSTWDNIRVSINIHESFEILESAKQKFPKCDGWNHAPTSGSLIIGKGYLQKKTTSVLTIGETLANRFFVKANQIGEFKVTIMMTSAGKIGERRQSLKIRVIENENGSTMP